MQPDGNPESRFRRGIPGVADGAKAICGARKAYTVIPPWQPVSGFPFASGVPSEKDGTAVARKWCPSKFLWNLSTPEISGLDGSRPSRCLDSGRICCADGQIGSRAMQTVHGPV